MNNEKRIQQLEERIRTLATERDEAINWNNVLLTMLTESEEKLNGIRNALGDEVIKEHPGKQRFRQAMQEEVEEDNA